MPERVLVVDDDPRMATAMRLVLDRRGYEVATCDSASRALAELARGSYAVLVTDLRMPGMDGHELLRRVRVACPALRAVVVTAHGDLGSAVSCGRDGAVDYLTKPFSPEALENAVAAALAARARPAALPAEADVVAEDPATRAALELALRAARSDVTVLLEAASGAGKEVFARLIHRASARREGPFVALNCAALPRELLEVELFGHRRGAFTGAVRDRRGHFEVASGGTLLLDEIGEMHHDLQARLLRVLQDRVVLPVGSESPIPVDVRVIAATHRNLREDVATGRFREDLYYRLRVLPLRIPPLAERPADIEPLALRFASRYAGPGARLTPEALARLRAHRWPGNVRELQNALERAAVLADGGPIGSQHLGLDEQPAASALPVAAAVAPLAEAERLAIGRELARAAGNRTQAAAALGISPRTLRHKLQRYREAGLPLDEAAS